MQIYDVHFRDISEDTIQFHFAPHDSDEEEKQEDVIGTMMADSLNDAKQRLIRFLRSCPLCRGEGGTF